MSARIRPRYPLAFKLYPYVRGLDQNGTAPAHAAVAVVGAGPVGLTCALDLGLRGQKVVVLDDHEGARLGSRAICFAKRTLEIAHRLRVGTEMLEKGVVWRKGRVFHDRNQIYEFDLLPETGHRCPAFVNLQQPYFEKFLFEAVQKAIAGGAKIDIRGANRVDAVEIRDDGVLLDVMTPEGGYGLAADWLIACDGARSPVREMLELGFDGRAFEDNFLIADIKMKADFPAERWFWFEPWFKSGASALLHKQPDDIWRIDFQLGWGIDRERELEEKNIRKRLDAMLGGDVAYDIVWSSIYTFQCRRMKKFRHGRVVFAGDSAHQVSPFGARGANSGVQDADNLGWKLDLVLRGLAPESLIDSYDAERRYAADENILNSTRSTDFLTPKSGISKIFRNAALQLAREHAFARTLINSGRLSVPCVYDRSLLNGEDMLRGPTVSRPGAPCPDAPHGDGFLLDHLGQAFTLLAVNCECPDRVSECGVTAARLSVDAPTDQLARRYLGEAQSGLYLIRPDQHVAARWADFDGTAVRRALRRVIGRKEPCI